MVVAGGRRRSAASVLDEHSTWNVEDSRSTASLLDEHSTWNVEESRSAASPLNEHSTWDVGIAADSSRLAEPPRVRSRRECGAAESGAAAGADGRSAPFYRRGSSRITRLTNASVRPSRRFIHA
jgi:hypothetical protein